MPTQAAILIIDDEPNLRHTLAVILQRGSYKVTSAADGKEALQYLADRPFDLAFLDPKLPDINGLDLFPKIRALRPKMPVLILTANATLESALEAVRQGARDYMLKPIDPPYILTRVNEVLAEQAKPQRRGEIASEVQGLLSELRQQDSTDLPSPAAHATVTAIDPGRFLRHGAFIADLHTRHIMLDKRYIPLAPVAFDYLVTLIRHAPEAVSFEALVKESQGDTVNKAKAREIARWQIRAIRYALEPDPRHPHHILNAPTLGYRLAA